MRDLIEEVDWDDILSPLNIHCAWKLFTKKSTAFIDKCIPQDIPRKNIFMNRRAINLQNRKQKLWNNYIHSKPPDQCYSLVRNELQNLTRHLWSNYENELVSGAKTNPRQLWKYINLQLKVHLLLGSLRGPDNTLVYSDSEKCELLNDHFSLSSL